MKCDRPRQSRPGRPPGVSPARVGCFAPMVTWRIHSVTLAFDASASMASVSSAKRAYVWRTLPSASRTMDASPEADADGDGADAGFGGGAVDARATGLAGFFAKNIAEVRG